MSRDQHEGDAGPEAQNFRVPPDHKRSGDESFPSAPERANTERKHASRTITTLEELDADIAARDKDETQRQAEWQKQENEKQRLWTERQREKWEPKTRALEALKVTGNIAEDARAFLEATRFNPENLDVADQEAYRNGDPQGLLRYFQEVDRLCNAAPSRRHNSDATGQDFSTYDGIVEAYFATYHRIVKEIIGAAETRQDRTANG